MPHHQHFAVEQTLLRATPSLLDKCVGAAAAVAGLGVGVFFVFLVWKMLASQGSIRWPGVLLAAIAAGAASLLLTASYRLLLRRPLPSQSLLGVWVWQVLCCVFLLCAGLVGYTIWHRGFDASSGQALTSVLLLGLLSYGAGAHFRTRNRTHARGSTPR